MKVLTELNALGAVITGRHFVYTSGKHGSAYVNPDPIFSNLVILKALCRKLAEPFRGDEIETVASPAVGGVALAIMTALALDESGIDVSAVWADKKGDDFVFERISFSSRLTGKRVLVVEDLLTTGGSVMKLCRQAERLGADIVGVSVICNRGRLTPQRLQVRRLESLVDVSFDAMNPDECDLCEQRIPIVVDIGHGADFRLVHPSYPGGYEHLVPS